MSNRERHLYEFGAFRLDTAECRLVRDGADVPLTPKAFDTLVALVRRGGQLVDKDELMKEVWPDSFVEEVGLARNISTLRKVLGQGEGGQEYIGTIPKRGYRFVAPVRELSDEGAELILRQPVAARIATEEEEETTPQNALEAATVISSPKRLERRWRVATVTALTAALVLVAATFLVRQHFSRASEAIDSIAVLPFVNTNADPNIEYLSDGLIESTINNLSQLNGLRVVPRSTVFRYKGKRIDPQEVARELGVRAVLTGEITQRGDTFIIRTELIDTTRDAQLWGEQYNRKLSDILAVQEDISREISDKLQLRLTGEGQTWLTKRHTGNAGAYQLYLKGRYFWNKRTEEGVQKGIEYLQQAIESDPGYALAYAGLADCYIVLGAPLNALPPGEAFLEAKAAATKALEIDDTLAEAHATLGVVKQRFDWDPEGAAKEFRRAIELNPGYATAHQWYAINFEIMGRHDEAIAEAQRAYELDPLSLIINARLGHSYYFARRYDQAIEQYRKTLELDPNFTIAHARLGWAYEQKGLHSEAIEEFLKADALSGKSPATVTALKQAFAASGMRGYWRKALELEREKAKHRYVSAYEIAALYARLNEREQAFEWLEKACEERSSGLVYLKVEPSFDSLRHHPRFADLLRRIHLA